MEKKEYVKPKITVIEVEPQQIICASIDEKVYGTNDLEEQNGEFW